MLSRLFRLNLTFSKLYLILEIKYYYSYKYNT